MDLISLRRDLHRHPEIGFTEFRTASIVIQSLIDLGYEVKYADEVMEPRGLRGVPSQEELAEAQERAIKDGANPDVVRRMEGGMTGVVGILRGNRPGPTVGFRFDMDALPVKESNEESHFPYEQEFSSQYPGSMHACGHDGHTSIGLELARHLSDGNFAGTVKLIFQPAEEGGRGAFSMVQTGVVDDVDRLFCMHLGLDVPLGEVCGGSTEFLATSKLLVEFHGVPSHSGAAPEFGRNALLGAATAAMSIHAIPRFSSGITRVNVGVLESGTAVNIVPYYARMLVETRASKTEDNAELENRVRNIVEHSAGMYGLSFNIEVIGQALTMKCDQPLIQLVLEEAQKVPEFHTFTELHRAGASEDASFLMNRVQERGGMATYMVVGTPIAAPHHNEKFDIGEDALPLAAQLLEKIARRTLA